MHQQVLQTDEERVSGAVNHKKHPMITDEEEEEKEAKRQDKASEDDVQDQSEDADDQNDLSKVDENAPA
jgi:hypothetical protein